MSFKTLVFHLYLAWVPGCDETRFSADPSGYGLVWLGDHHTKEHL